MNLKELWLHGNAVKGPFIPRAKRLRVLLTFFPFSGELPKQLPVSLEVLSLGDDWQNTNKFTGGIPCEWGALPNFKELKMVACALDGKPLSTRRTERLRV